MLNIQSLNFDKANYLVADFCSDLFLNFICLTETWCYDYNIKSYVFPNYELIAYFNRHHDRAGGVAIWCRQSLNVSRIDMARYCSDNNIEVCCVKWITSKKKVVFMILCYRPPNGNFELFYDNLSSILLSLYKPKVCMLLLGDFNENAMTNGQSIMFRDLVSTYNLDARVTKPTRVTASRVSILDQIFVDAGSGGESDVFPCAVSDHRAVLYNTGYSSASNDSGPVQVIRRVYTEDSIGCFVNYMRREQWTDVYSAVDVNGMFDAFHDALIYNFNLAFPLRRLRVRGNDKMWVNREVVTSSRRLRDLHDLFGSGVISKTQ